MREGWTYKKLMEVCDKGSSNHVISKLEGNNGEYPLYGASGLVKGVDFYQQEKPYIGIVKDGAGVGRVNIYPAQSSLVGTMQYIFPKDTCSLDYIKYFLIKLDLSKHVSGATIPHIYFKDYGKELIPLPPKSHQEAIVSELDEINSLLALKREQLQKYDKLAQSLFYEMFGDPIENEKGWEVKKLGEICKFSQGVQIDVDKQLKSPCHGYKKFLRIVDYTTNNDDARYVLNDEKYIIKKEDVAVVRYGASAGSSGIHKEGILANNLFKVGYPREIINYIFLFRYFQSEFYSSFLHRTL